MAKDPAFLFYPNDYIGGTMGLTFEEKGAYMELLMMQFNRGHMTSRMIGQTIGKLWDNIKDKFQVDDKGLFYNPRLEEEQIKRKRFTDSRSNNKKGTNQHSKKRGHMTSHMEDENENEDKDENLKGSMREKINFSDLENTQWFESILRYLQLKINFEELAKYWQKFQDAMIADNDLFRDKDDYRSHFRNWVVIQIEKNEKNRTNNRTGFKSDTTEQAIKSVANGFIDYTPGT